MKASEFDFELPVESIAQQALPRGTSNLMFLNKSDHSINHHRFSAILDIFQPGDCLIVNNSRVFPARLLVQKKETGAKIELLLHQQLDEGLWTAMARPTKRLKPGTELVAGNDCFTVKKIEENGRIQVAFESAEQSQRVIDAVGVTPLPPYIQREGQHDRNQENIDRERYQTVYAEHDGSIAAPTAGLHFSDDLIEKLKAKGVHVAPVTLHVGWGTFSPLPEGDLDNSRLHTEYYDVPRETADSIKKCKKNGKKVIACGTTSARTLEAAALDTDTIRCGFAKTDIFIKPGYTWKIVDGLLTNFHLPQSSLLILVCAFAGQSFVLDAYKEAVQRDYRFYSYGDAMLIL